MTLQTYTPEDLEKLTFRFFDLAAQLRNMVKKARKYGLKEIPLHDKKALLWCESLEVWAKKTQINLDILVTELPIRPKRQNPKNPT